jgi:hypothetical protein
MRQLEEDTDALESDIMWCSGVCYDEVRGRC